MGKPNTTKQDLVNLLQGQKALTFLKFMTPFANELLVRELVDKYEISEKIASEVADHVLGSKSQKERMIDWVISAFSQVTKLADTPDSRKLLIDSVRQYLDLFKDSGMPRGTLKLAKTLISGSHKSAIKDFDKALKSASDFEATILARNPSASFLNEGYEPFTANDESSYSFYYVTTPSASVAYVLYTYLLMTASNGLNRSGKEQAQVVTIGDSIILEYPSAHFLNRTNFNKDVFDYRKYAFDITLESVLFEKSYNQGVASTVDFDAPMWMFQVPMQFKIDSFDLHLTRLPQAESIFTITPSDFKSKVKDYKYAPVMSSRRFDVKLVSRDRHPRSVGFAWGLDKFCKLREDVASSDSRVAEKAKDEMHRILNFFGKSGFFIRAEFALSCFYFGDMDTQTIFLLSDISDIIPFSNYHNNLRMDENVLLTAYDPESGDVVSSDPFETLSDFQFISEVCDLAQTILTNPEFVNTGMTLIDKSTSDVRLAALKHLQYAYLNGLDTSFAEHEMLPQLKDVYEDDNYWELELLFGKTYADALVEVAEALASSRLGQPHPILYDFIEVFSCDSTILESDDPAVVFLDSSLRYTPTYDRPIIGIQVDGITYLLTNPSLLLEDLDEASTFPLAIYVLFE